MVISSWVTAGTEYPAAAPGLVADPDAHDRREQVLADDDRPGQMRRDQQ